MKYIINQIMGVALASELKLQQTCFRHCSMHAMSNPHV